MSDFTLGRAGRPTASGGDGIVLKLTESPSRDGDEVSVRGEVRGREQASLGALRAAVAQLQGYGPQNADEPRVPVTWAQDPTLDGFHEVISVDVGAEVSGRLAANADHRTLVVPFQARLVRVATATAPLTEVYCGGAVRSNAHSITSAGVVPWVAIPGAADSYWPTGDVGSGTVSVEGGTVRVFGDVGETEMNNGSAFYRVAPSGFYEGACRIETTGDAGSSWHVVTGRQMASNPDLFRMSNGRVRIRQVSTADGALRVEHYDSAAQAWEATDFVMVGSGAESITEPDAANSLRNWSAAIIARNSVEAVSVGLVYGGPTSPESAIGSTLWLTVRRGAPFVEGSFAKANRVANVKWGLYRTASETGANVSTYGIEANANDANGNKYRIMSPVAVTQDITGTSGLYTTSVTSSFRFSVAVVDADLVTGRSMAQTYFAAMNHRQTVTAR